MMDKTNIIHKALFKAIDVENEEIFDILLPGSDLKSFTIDGELSCPLFLAVSIGQKSMAMKLLQHGCPICDERNKKGQNSLLLAIENKFPEVALRMIEQGSDIDCQDTDGFNALVYAGFYGQTEVAMKLINKGCDIYAQNTCNFTALNAVAYGDCDMNVAMTLIKMGCDLNQQDAKDRSALIVATSRGKSELVFKLIEMGCNLNRNNDAGWNALMMAIKYGHTKVIKKLIERGCDLNGRLHSGKTTLKLVIENADEEMVKIFIENGCNVDNEEEPMVKNIMSTLKNDAKALYEVLQSDEYIYQDFPQELMPFLFRNDVIPSFRKRKLDDSPNPAKKQKRS